MKAILILIVAFVALIAASSTQDFFAKELARIAQEVNTDPSSTWTAEVNDRFKGVTEQEALRSLGAFFDEKPYLKQVSYTEEELKDLPTSFYAPDTWPQCRDTIETIVDQSNCGSCWAVAVASAATDRLCIADGPGAVLSSKDLLACDNSWSSGCNGGYPSGAWSFITSEGLVTGKGYDDKVGACLSYPFPPCAHYGDHDTYAKCNTFPNYNTPKCSKSCDIESNYDRDYNKDKVRFKDAYSVYGEQNMMKELVTNGPFSVSFTVYSDFLNYKGGVYRHTSGNRLGGHAVRLVGYGVSDENDAELPAGTKYWIISNSWNSGWGEKGNFRMIRGINDCGIESGAHAGRPRN